jgi:RNA-directed DNA polymerase
LWIAPETIPQALERVAQAVVHNKTRVIDVDLKACFDTVRHDFLLKKVAERIDDDQVMHLLKLMLKAISFTFVL